MNPERTLSIELRGEAVDRLIASAAEQAAEIVIAKLETRSQHERWLNLREAATYTRIPYGTLQKLASARKIPGATKPGKHWILDRHALDDWLQDGAAPHRPTKPT